MGKSAARLASSAIISGVSRQSSGSVSAEDAAAAAGDVIAVEG